MRAAVLVLAAVVATTASAAEPPTVVESTNYSRTSLYSEVINFVQSIATSSDLVAVSTLTHSPRGRQVPLVVLSKERVRTPADLRATGKPAVLIMANIHAGEVEGKEACQMLIRDVASGALVGVLESQVVLVIPIFNTDGNDQLGDNRGDDGPELAGVRHNGQFLDLNRDYTKLESPEVRGLVSLLATWDPVLVVDMHTTNGSYHREPVTYTTCMNPNGAKELAGYMWSSLFPAVAERLRELGWDSVPYGNFSDRENPEKGWENDAIGARYGADYVGLRNRLTILDENYSHADFKTRVLSSYAFVRAVLEYTNANAREIATLIRATDAATRETYHNQLFVDTWELAPLMDVTIKSYEFDKVPLTAEERERWPGRGEFRVVPTEVHRDYTAPYLAVAAPERTVSLPVGYVLMPGQEDALDTLLAHGIAVERLQQGCTVAAEQFMPEKVELADRLYQGHAFVTVTGAYQEAQVELPAGCHFVDLRQPLARLVAVLLEPTSEDGLATWGFFNRTLVRQWSSRVGVYPVVRLAARPPVPLEVVHSDM